MEEGIKNISMVNRAFILIVYVFLAHGLHAQQTMRKDTCMKDNRQEMRDTMQEKNGKRMIAYQKCKGNGSIEQNMFVGFEQAKEKNTCSVCGVEYGNNVRHFHVTCFDCQGEGLFPN